jgi:hypothetical protein
MEALQLEFNLDDLTPIEQKMNYMETRVENIEKKSDNVRKGLFSRHNELSKMLLSHRQRIEHLENKLIEAEKYLRLIAQYDKLAS